MRKLVLICAILGLSFGFVACGDDDGGSNSSKAANGDKCSVNEDCQSGLCKDKVCAAKDDGNDDKAANGERCDVNEDCQSGLCKDKVCAAKDDGNDDKAANGEDVNEDCQSGLCKDKVCAANDGGNDACDKTCSGDFPECDAETKSCYKVNEDYAIICENKDGVKTAYIEEWIYEDTSIESKYVSEVCTGETSDCKEGIGCTVPTTNEEKECYTHEDCEDNAPKTVCGPEYKCVEPECQTNADCKDETKPTCDAGLCMPAT